MPSIVVKDLGKAYKQYPTRWSRLVEWLTPGHKPRHSLKWVLQDINFTVNAGEAVGIVGVNGAGKSTLLKMITGTTQPTTGSVQINGRVAALLELGMGFHPDFTGRQNAYMAGQLLGYRVEEITELMPEIEAFAEIGDYIEQPVRVYSSGMQVRLAFAVATAIRPDVLIVDEALSVGDAYFQHKSFRRIREFRDQGTTLLIVSHDRQAIQTICDKVVLLNGGLLDMIGAPDTVMDYYFALLAEKQKGHSIVLQTNDQSGKAVTVSGTGEASVKSIRMLDVMNQVSQSFEVGELITLEVEVSIVAAIPKLVLGFMIRDRVGNPIYGTNTHHTKHVITDVNKGTNYLYKFKFPINIGVGTFSISTALVSSDTRYSNNYECNELAFMFQTVNTKHSHFAGNSWLNADVSVVEVK